MVGWLRNILIERRHFKRDAAKTFQSSSETDNTRARLLGKHIEIVDYGSNKKIHTNRKQRQAKAYSINEKAFFL